MPERRVRVSEIAEQIGISRPLLHYYLRRTRRAPRIDDLTGTHYFWESEVPTVVREIAAYQERVGRV